MVTAPGLDSKRINYELLKYRVPVPILMSRVGTRSGLYFSLLKFICQEAAIDSRPVLTEDKRMFPSFPERPQVIAASIVGQLSQA
jgi:hypothetical protein